MDGPEVNISTLVSIFMYYGWTPGHYLTYFMLPVILQMDYALQYSLCYVVQYQFYPHASQCFHKLSDKNVFTVCRFYGSSTPKFNAQPDRPDNTI